MSEAMIKSKSLKDLVLQDEVKNRLKEIMGDRSPQFTAALVQLVNGSEQLQKCEPKSVIGAAIMAAAMDLSVDPNLGEAHIVPYGERAQFQVGAKGLIQLAMRSNQYKAFGSTVVHEGQLVSYDELTGELVIDKSKKTSERVIGYAAKFKLLNGFERGEYWTAEEMENHALMYSKSYRYCKGKPDKEKTCLWITKRDEMGIKTVEKSLLNHYGPKSIEIRRAIKVDGGAVIDVESETVSYIDNEEESKLSKPDFSDLTKHEMGDPEPASPTVVSDSRPPEKPMKQAKSAPKPHDTTKSEPSSYNKYKAVKLFVEQAGLNEGILLEFLNGMGLIDETVTKLESVPQEIIDMVEEQHETIIEKIKQEKGNK